MISVEVRPGNFSSHHLADLGQIQAGEWSHEAHARFQSDVSPIATNKGQEPLGERYRVLEKAVDNFLIERLTKAAEELRLATDGRIDIKVGEPVRHQLFVVPVEQRYGVEAIKDRFGNSCGEGLSGFFRNDSRTAVVFSKGRLLSDADTLAHERHHSIGSIMVATSSLRPGRLMGRTGHKMVGKIGTRGRLLEEASAVECGIDFLISPQFRNTFPDELRKMLESVAASGGKYKDVAEAVKRRGEYWYGKEGEYWLFYRVRQRMIEGARLVEPQFENLLMLSRIHPPLERLVRDACDKAFGRGTYRWIRKMNHAMTKEDKLEVKQLLNWLDLPKRLTKRGKFERKKKRETAEDLTAVLERFSFPVDREAREKMTMVWDRMLLTDKYLGELEANKIVLSSGLAYLEMRGDVVGLTKYLYHRVSSRKF